MRVKQASLYPGNVREKEWSEKGMEIEALFSSSKWEILQLLAKQPASPLQLSELLNTSVANVSQQLRLLEVLGLVSSSRVANREKGKPRAIYTLAGDFVYTICLGSRYAGKQLIKATPIHSVIGRILCISDTGWHYPLLRAFWSLEPDLKQIQALVFEPSAGTLYVVSQKSQVLKLPSSYSFPGQKSISVKAVAQFKQPQGEFSVIYDPENTIEVKK